MDEARLARIEAKIDDANDRLAAVVVTLAAQHVSIKEHIRRTNLLEQELKPIKVHVYRVEGGLKLITLIATIAAILTFIHRL